MQISFRSSTPQIQHLNANLQTKVSGFEKAMKQPVLYCLSPKGGRVPQLSCEWTRSSRHRTYQTPESGVTAFLLYVKPYCPDSWEELVCFGHIISPISTRPHSRRISKCRNNLQTSKQIYVIGFRSCRKYSAWQTCKSWKTTIILTVIIILPSTPLSCFSERNLIRLAAWHILTPKSSKIDCPKHNNPQNLQIFVISILQSDIKLLEVASDKSTYDRYRILRFEANGQGT